MDILLKDVTKKFGDVTAVDHLNLLVEDGQLVSLLGPSGCGKSTTLYMLSGLQDPTSGSVFFGDEDVTKLPPEQRGIGLVFQNYALYPHMTVIDNIMFPLINMKVPKGRAREQAIEMAKLVQIDGLLDRKPKELSGGQQQRVAIARALVKKPKLLLLDEPLSNLDAKLRVETREEIRRIQQEVGITTIFVTHDQEEAMSISDKMAVMEKGVLQQYEKPQEMYKKPKNEFVAKFLGTPQINMCDAVVENGVMKTGDFVLREKVALPDGPVRAGVRPEMFVVSENGTPVIVHKTQLRGRDFLVDFDMGDNHVRALIDNDIDVQEGKELKVSVKPDTILCFDADTKLALGKF